MKTLALIFLPIAISLSPCTNEDLLIVKPFYETTQKVFGVLTPFDEISETDCQVFRFDRLSTRPRFILTIPEFKDKKCELRYVLTKQAPYVKGKPRLTEAVSQYLKRYEDLFMRTKDEVQCFNILNADTPETRFERLKWHFEMAEEKIKAKLLQNLQKEGHLVLIADLLEKEYKKTTGDDNNPHNNDKSHTLKILVKHYEKEIAFHFRHTYEHHHKLAMKLAEENKEYLESGLRKLFDDHKDQILAALNGFNNNVLLPLEKKMIEESAHNCSGYLNTHFPMLKSMYPNYETEVQGFMMHIVSSPQVITLAFGLIETYIPKLSSAVVFGIKNVSVAIINKIEDMMSTEGNCDSDHSLLYDVGKNYVTPLHSDLLNTHYKMSCKASNHHVNGFLFKKFTFHYVTNQFECDIIVESASHDVLLTANYDLHSKYRKCSDFMISEYSNACGLWSIYPDMYNLIGSNIIII